MIETIGRILSVSPLEFFAGLIFMRIPARTSAFFAYTMLASFMLMLIKSSAMTNFAMNINNFVRHVMLLLNNDCGLRDTMRHLLGIVLLLLHHHRLLLHHHWLLLIHRLLVHGLLLHHWLLLIDGLLIDWLLLNNWLAHCCGGTSIVNLLLDNLVWIVVGIVTLHLYKFDKNKIIFNLLFN